MPLTISDIYLWRTIPKLSPLEAICLACELDPSDYQNLTHKNYHEHKLPKGFIPLYKALILHLNEGHICHRHRLSSQIEKICNSDDYHNASYSGQRRGLDYYEEIDWDKVNTQLNNAVNSVRIDSIQQVYNVALAKLNKAHKILIETDLNYLPDSDISAELINQKRKEALEVLKKISDTKRKKIVR